MQLALSNSPCPHEDLVPFCNVTTHIQNHSLSVSRRVKLRVLAQLLEAAGVICMHFPCEQVTVCQEWFSLYLLWCHNASLGGEDSGVVH